MFEVNEFATFEEWSAEFQRIATEVFNYECETVSWAEACRYYYDDGWSPRDTIDEEHSCA